MVVARRPGFRDSRSASPEQLDDVSHRVRAFVSARERELALDDGTVVRLIPSSPERWSRVDTRRFITSRRIERARRVLLVGSCGVRQRPSGTSPCARYRATQKRTRCIRFHLPISSSRARRWIDCASRPTREVAASKFSCEAACDGFHALGLPVRIKTAKESVVASFRRCALLAFDRVKDPKAHGVRKTRGTKSVVVLPTANRGGRWRRDGDDERDYSNWRRDSSESTSASAFSKKKTEVFDPVSAFNAALNRATPDSIESTAERPSAALHRHSAAFGACADRLVAAAAAQTNYAMTYARCVAATAAEFRDAVRIRATERLRSSDDASLRRSGRIHRRAWRANVVADDEFERCIFDEAYLDADAPNFARVDVAFRALLRFGETLARRPGPPTARSAAASAPRAGNVSPRSARRDERSFSQRRWTSTRAVISKPPDDDNSDDHRPRRRAPTPRRPRAREKSLVVSYDDGGEERAAILRGERKGWIFWYVGSPVTSRSLDTGAPRAYTFVTNDSRGRRRRGVRVTETETVRGPGGIEFCKCCTVQCYVFASENVNIITVDCRQFTTRTGFPPA